MPGYSKLRTHNSKLGETAPRRLRATTEEMMRADEIETEVERLQAALIVLTRERDDALALAEQHATQSVHEAQRWYRERQSVRRLREACDEMMEWLDGEWGPISSPSDPRRRLRAALAPEEEQPI